jgi:hypothetical protein
MKRMKGMSGIYAITLAVIACANGLVYSAAPSLYVENRTDDPLNVKVSVGLGSDQQKDILPGQSHTFTLSWYSVFDAITFMGLSGLTAGMKLKEQLSRRSSSLKAIVSAAVLDKDKVQKELDQLKQSAAQLEKMSVPSGQNLTLAQLKEQKDVMDEYQGILQDIKNHEFDLADFDARISSLQKLLPSQEDPQAATLLKERIDTSLKTGKIAPSLIVSGLRYADDSTLWPALDGRTCLTTHLC